MKQPLFSLRTLMQCMWVAALAVALHCSAAHARIIPSGGSIYEEWMQGTNQTIEWDTSAFHGTLTISLWNRNTASYTILTTSATALTGSYVWSIPGNHATGNYFRIRIAENSNPDRSMMSGTFFAIAEDPAPIVTGAGDEPVPGAVG